MTIKQGLTIMIVTAASYGALMAQQGATQIASIMQSVLATLEGNSAIADVSLTGTCQMFAGSDQDSGPMEVKGTLAGSSRVDLNLSSGQISEIRTLANGIPVGSWRGPAGSLHHMAYHNLMTEPVWFFPAFVISHTLDSKHYVTTYIGQEVKNSTSVQHFQVVKTAANTAGGLEYQQLSKIDLYLDSNTLLPSAIGFFAHPDNNARLNLPVEVHFSDYRNTGGMYVPFHVQKFLNNGLVTDLQIQAVVINSNLPASDFAVQ